MLHSIERLFDVEENGCNLLFIIDVVAELVDEFNYLEGYRVLDAQGKLFGSNLVVDGRS